MRKQDVGKNLLLVLSSTLVVLLAVELIGRVFMLSTHKIIKYGWVVSGNSQSRQVVEDSPGKLVEIKIKYFDNGFKRWGNVNTKKIKMLILGDSYTEMNCVSNGEEWYSYLEKEFKDLELFVYGAGGYGSLQEYMVLDDYIDMIKPDLILLQFCENDFTNNLYDLDMLNYPYNNHSSRPYLVNGAIVYKDPLPFSELRKSSFIVNRILKIYDKIAFGMAKRDLQAYKKQRDIQFHNLSKKEKDNFRQLKKESFLITNQIMAMIKKRAGIVPVYFLDISFSVYSRAQELCKKNNLIYVPDINESVIASAKDHKVRVVNDGHWNKFGNKIAGEKLVGYFKRVGLFKLGSNLQ